jgi:hypothetical protein
MGCVVIVASLAIEAADAQLAMRPPIGTSTPLLSEQLALLSVSPSSWFPAAATDTHA